MYKDVYQWTFGMLASSSVIHFLDVIFDVMLILFDFV